jgi:hypothetical protein
MVHAVGGTPEFETTLRSDRHGTCHVRSRVELAPSPACWIQVLHLHRAVCCTQSGLIMTATAHSVHMISCSKPATLQVRSPQSPPPIR